MPLAPDPRLAEIQGLYGSFGFPEKLLQKIWLRGEFDRAAARLTDGRTLQIVNPGRWNLLGGPDFRGARLRFGGGPERWGDVEVHLRAPDWDAHRHADDRAYDDVILHVVLFPPEGETRTRGARGEIPVLVLLPLLHHDLEEFAREEAVESLSAAALARLPEELASLAPSEVRARLMAWAAQRWEVKVHHASRRLQRLGWTEACHHAALEILGFRFNRAPMLRIAGRFPLEAWTDGLVPEDLLSSESGWSLQGVRPANQPLVRLRQYARWTRAVPAWPEVLAGSLAGHLRPDPAATTRMERRRAGLGDLRVRWRHDVAGDAVGGSRFDTLVCDGWLPLLAARGARDLSGLWFHWFPGDWPPTLRRALTQGLAGSPLSGPLCHGLAQGLLGWLLARPERGS